jgi:hypothetical protein
VLYQSPPFATFYDPVTENQLIINIITKSNIFQVIKRKKHMIKIYKRKVFMRVENCLEKLEKLYFVSEKRKPERRDKLNVGIFFS